MFSPLKFALVFMSTAILGRKSVQFVPDDLPLLSGNISSVPGLFDLSASLTKAQNVSFDSWWTSTYATSYAGDQYFIITHMINEGSGVITRGAFRNLKTYAYSQIQNITDNGGTFYNSATGLADLKGPGYSLVSVSDTDPLVGYHVQTNVHEVHIDMTFNTTSPALVSTGAGAFILSNRLTYQWSIPQARTSGTLTVNGTEIELDPNHSITWLDRQWSDASTPTITTPSSSGAASWHWFQLHISLPGSRNKLNFPISAWMITYDGGIRQQFASVRQTPGIQQVIPIKSVDTEGPTWTSPYTNITYEQDYKLTLADGSYLDLAVVTDDQELHSDNGASPAYQGYLKVTGVYQGSNVSGFGLVEIIKSF